MQMEDIGGQFATNLKFCDVNMALTSQPSIVEVARGNQWLWPSSNLNP
jgi:hypothetical protein